MASLAATFGRGAMTNGWTDIGNADVILAMGGNPAENHPVGFRFVMEAKPWDWAIDRIARKVKETRDARFVQTDAAGRAVNALTAMGVIGGCTDTNEINYLLVKAFRAGLGVVPIEQQSRI